MRPPARTRRKPDRNSTTRPGTQHAQENAYSWSKKERQKLVNALTVLRREHGELTKIDFSLLNLQIPSRSVSELQSVVESLQNKVISSASSQMKAKMSAMKKMGSPIEIWTRLASAVCGSIKKPISSAFSQMLTVASTEPCTLQNCDPPQLHTALRTDCPVGRTVPLTPVLSPVKAEVVFKTQAAAKRPEHDPPFATMSSCQVSVTQEPSSSHTPIIPPAASPVSAARPITSHASSSASYSSNFSSTSASPSQHAKPAVMKTHFSHTSKHITIDSSRVLGVNFVVDFERIYNYLSTINQPDCKYELTPMESAIVLDLLMSLPEELPLLDCKKLHSYLIQVYDNLSKPSSSKQVKEMLQELKTRQQGSTQPEPQQECSGTSSPNESSGSNGLTTDVKHTEHCPPLNPLMIPLDLLKRA
ncbi:snRNA-activating protein complex subunit 2 [Entelurus aequoreus]|uniref:snRNA-activating protein complex subunit 2 n=1 Tax=Entelurus aequoreus TaxID=161455 RepID=UPI002B1DD27B|nr:snRNA-activating protein complex subunit 2 [Entelurus aequoreus]